MAKQVHFKQKIVFFLLTSAVLVWVMVFCINSLMSECIKKHKS